MIWEPFEPLSFVDQVLLCRVNLCCTAILLALFGCLAVSCDWRSRVLALLASAGLALAAGYVEPMLRRFDAALGAGERRDPWDC